MNYIETLYYYKKNRLDKIIDNENKGFYLINGYNSKLEDIKYIEKIDYMISKWETSSKMIWNEITKTMNNDNHKFNSKKLSFKQFILNIKLEKSLIIFKNNVDELKNNLQYE